MTTCSMCKQPVSDGFRLCTKHREQKRIRQMRARELRSWGLCTRCGSRDSLPLTRHCGRCLAYLTERSHPHLEHDLEAHAKMLELSRRSESLCTVTGRSGLSLMKVGEKLSVDRIDSSLGYVEGNMQLMALSLNSAKGAGPRVPQSAVHMLLRKLERVKDDCLSLVPGATNRI